MGDLKKYNIVLLCITFFVFFNAQSQTRDTLKSILNSELIETLKLDSVETFLNSKNDIEKDSLHYLYYDYARWLRKINKELAVRYGKKAIDQVTQFHPSDTSFRERSNLGLAYTLERNGDYKNAMVYYQNVIDVGYSPNFEINSYEKLGFLALGLQDYQKAIQYYQATIELIQKYQKRASLLSGCYNNIQFSYAQLNGKENLLLAEKYALKADSVIQTNAAHPLTVFNVKLGLAEIYNQFENLDIDKSLHYYNQALEIASEYQDSARIGLIYYGKGALLNSTDTEASLDYYHKGLQYATKQDTLNKHLIYSGIGATYTYKKEYLKSIEASHEALRILVGDDFRKHKTKRYQILDDTPFKKDLLNAIPFLADAYLRNFEETTEPVNLKEAISYFEYADYLIDLLKTNSSEFKSRLFWRQLSTKIYNKAIRACYLDKNNEKAFYFMEKNKALLLIEDLAQEQFKQSLNLSPQLLEKETELKKEILKIERLLKEGLNNVGSLKKQLVDEKNKLSSFHDSLMYKANMIKIENNILSLEEVQQKISENELVVEYSIPEDNGFGIYSNTNNGYVLFITKNDVEFAEIPNLPVLRDEVSELISKLKTPFKTSQDITAYTALSNTIYFKLFPSEKIRNRLKNRKITIIPDAYLSLLPFGALSTKLDETHYFIKDCEISYLYSNSFLNNLARPENSNSEYLGIAPVEFQNDQLIKLANSSLELDYIEQYYSGNRYLNEAATKQTFVEKAPNYNIIHLATHADAQDATSPWIAFHDEKITLEELYLTKNTASLVLLSGCNTTLGKQESGEGVMSLARGFFYSGAQSVISSLWKIDDRATSTIVNQFYANLSEGATKSQSLHRAKLDYLNSHSLSESSPYYWSSFILLGENDTLPAPMKAWKFYVPFLFLVIGGFFGYKIFKKKKKEN